MTCATCVFSYDRERERAKPRHTSTGTHIPPPPAANARNDRHVTNTLRAAHDEHVSTDLLHVTDVTPDLALHPQTRALTTTGPGLYTHQASATASTSLCVVLPLIP